MVLMEKALNIKRLEIKEDTVTTYGTVIFQTESFMEKLRVNSKNLKNKLTTSILGIKTNMSDLIIWGTGTTKFSDQITVKLRKTSVNQPQIIGEFELDTKLYNMEPFSGPEKQYNLGIDLYDIESSWKE